MMKLPLCQRAPLLVLLSVDIALSARAVSGVSLAEILFKIPQSPEKGNCGGKEIDKASFASPATLAAWKTCQAAWAMLGARDYKFPLVKNVHSRADRLARLKKVSGPTLISIILPSHIYGCASQLFGCSQLPQVE